MKKSWLVFKNDRHKTSGSFKHTTVAMFKKYDMEKIEKALFSSPLSLDKK